MGRRRAMEAVVLAAGEGLRLRPFTVSRPKVMIEIANKPIVEYVVRALAETGIRDIIMVVGYKKESVMSYFGNGGAYNVRIEYVVQKKQLGTAHALLTAKDALDSDEFLVLAGDNIVGSENLQPVIKSEAITVGVTESDIPSKYGVVLHKNEYVIDIIEKPERAEMRLINTGIYKLTSEIFDYIPQCIEEGKYGISHVLSHMIKTGTKIRWERVGSGWRDIVYPWDIVEANAHALTGISRRIEGDVERNAVIKGRVVIGKDTVIRSGCYIRGPVIIGEGCEIGPNVYISGGSVIGNDVTIMANSTVEESVIFDESIVGTSSHISRSVIGWGSVLGSGVRCPSSSATVVFGDEVFNLESTGAMVGEGCKIMSNCVIMPGAIVGAYCKVKPLRVISGTIEDGSIVV
ncbi:MAG: hypothetical protein DRN20_03185 [Thermoplasmata archaeon]|nr:MAG: hypothetical protein DRN20_03185 [Thermoplasmata archaeon]